MGIRERVSDAGFLWKHEHHEGALINILAAVAASARKQYPQLRDRESFVEFLGPRIISVCHVDISGIEFRGELWAPAALFYKWFRCQLIHEGELPIDAEFVNSGKQLFVRAGDAPRPPLQISYEWFWVLVRAVKEASINKDIY